MVKRGLYLVMVYIPHHVVIDHNEKFYILITDPNISGIMEVIEEALLHVPRDEDQDGVLR